jgi:hypothetical protein
LNAALGDAAWLTGLERNSDVVLLEAYAPMLVNVNPGASQWPTNLIGYGSSSYYVQQLFSLNHGDVVLPATLTAPGTESEVYASVTRDSVTGMIYLKVVNAADEVQPVSVSIKGGRGADSTGKAIVLTSNSPQDTNTLSEPRKIVRITTPVSGLGRNFEYRFEPHSVTVLQIGPGGTPLMRLGTVSSKITDRLDFTALSLIPNVHRTRAAARHGRRQLSSIEARKALTCPAHSPIRVMHANGLLDEFWVPQAASRTKGGRCGLGKRSQSRTRAGAVHRVRGRAGDDGPHGRRSGYVQESPTAVERSKPDGKHRRPRPKEF